MMRAPVMPNGWPRRDRAAVDVELVPWDAEVLRRRHDLRGERLVDLHEVDVVDRHARAGERRRLASIGPRPMISGSTADTADATTRASGVMPSSSALASLITTTAAAPSFSGQALPAVTVPSGRNTGCSCESFSTVVSGARAVVDR